MSYHILKRQQPYQELGGNYFDERKKELVLRGLVKRISKLGYEVSLELVAA
jgi:alpha-D-ribose 1-methylphosphonate 5-phosphate C-P lyase